VEGTFGVLKEDYGFRRFFMNMKKNVRTEILLLGLGYNINKLHHKIQKNRCGFLLWLTMTLPCSNRLRIPQVEFPETDLDSS
jgi:hypothetical protein